MNKPVRLGFQQRGVTVPIASILPLRQISPYTRSSQKFRQFVSSIREVGVIEPLIVCPQRGSPGTYLLLDGHVRLEALKQLGHSHARCLVSTDDEAFTYNKRVNRLSTIQEHTMVLQAIKNGVPEERIARVLSVDVASIRQKRDLLNGICAEAVNILKNRQMSPKSFVLLKRMKPVRQIEVAELLAAANNFGSPYIKALLAATPADMLLDPDKHKVAEGLTPEQMAKMERETEVLHRELKLVEESHGNEVLNLVLARGYLMRLFANARITRYLGQYHSEIFRELRSVCEGSSLNE